MTSAYTIRWSHVGLGLALHLAAACAAFADDGSLDAGLNFSAPVMDAVLQDSRGGTQLAQSDLQATFSENTASRVQTGDNLINGGAFANLSGVSVVIQNSGANVLIQNALTLNLQVN